MIARVFAILAASSIFLAVSATPSPGGHGGSVDQCNGGTVSCCEQVDQAHSVNEKTSLIMTLIGIDVGGLTGLVGSNCSPITALGVGSGASCSTQQVCCQKNYQNGLVNVGCSPINVAL